MFRLAPRPGTPSLLPLPGQVFIFLQGTVQRAAPPSPPAPGASLPNREPQRPTRECPAPGPSQSGAHRPQLQDWQRTGWEGVAGPSLTSPKTTPGRWMRCERSYQPQFSTSHQSSPPGDTEQSSLEEPTFSHPGLCSLCQRHPFPSVCQVLLIKWQQFLFFI